MTPLQFRETRLAIGKRWLSGGVMTMGHLGTLLRLKGDAALSVRDYERGHSEISGPLAVAMEMMLTHGLPGEQDDQYQS